MNTELLTVSQTAKYLQLSERTIRRLIGNGSLQASKLANRAWRIRACDIDKYVAATSNNKVKFEDVQVVNNAAPRLISLDRKSVV